MSKRSAKRSAVLAPAGDLARAGARSLKSAEGGDVLEYKGWRFTSFHTNIIDSTEAGEMQDSIYSRLDLSRPASGGHKDEQQPSGTAEMPNNGPNLRIPPMIFGHDVMRIEKGSEGGGAVPSVFDDGTFELSLDAEDALTLWAAQHTPANLAKHPLSVIQVPYAAIWSKLNGPASALNTSQSEAKNTAATERSSPERKLQREAEAIATTTTSVGSSSSPVQIDRRSPLWDWTFSSDYCCTLGKPAKSRQHIVGVKELFSPLIGPSSDENPSVSPSTSPSPIVSSVKEAAASGVEYDLLRANDVPILFYDEILLYQDDLEDCGEVVFEAKLRVMPHCWFLLSRMFLRVDGVMLRIRDNRFFHRFGTDAVHLEVTWKECKLAIKMDKESGGGGGGGGGGGDTEAARPAEAGHLHIDGSALRDINKLAQIVPVISSKNLTLSIPPR